MNPELRRNLWLEITTHRLIAMPIVLGFVFIAVAAMNKDGSPEQLVSLTALAGFCLLTALWGSRLAANSIFDELTDKTWDWQRLSTLGPWTMTWGKLFGATAFAWYGGLICVVTYLFTAEPEFRGSPLKLVVTLISTTVLLHAGVITLALHISRRMQPGSTPSRRSVGTLLLLVLINIVAFLIAKNFDNIATVRWFGRTYEVGDFVLVSIAIFAIWAVLGAYRTMCQCLAVRTTPWAWLAFLLHLTVYCAGFIANVQGDWISPRDAMLISGFGWSVILFYFMAFSEPSGPIVVRRVLQKVQSGQWRRAFEEVPFWPITWAYAVLFAGGLTAASFDASSNLLSLRQISMAPIPIVLLALRDVAILLFFSAASKPNRAVGTAVVYILVLSWILPWMLYAVNLRPVARIVLPLGWGDSTEQLASAVVQAGIAGWLAYRRIRAGFSTFRQADGA